MTERHSCVAQLPEQMMLGGVVGSGKVQSRTLGGRTDRRLGRPEALLFVRVQKDPDASCYITVDATGKATQDLDKAAWQQLFSRLDDSGFQAAIPLASLRGQFTGVLAILVYPQPGMGSRTWLRAQITAAVAPPSSSIERFSEGVSKSVRSLLAQPIAELGRGLIESIE